MGSEGMHKLESSVSYSPPRIGGVAAHQENAAKPPLKAQTAWSFETDHPVRAFLTFDGASTPPILGGEYARPAKFSSQRGQALVEVAIQIPLMLALLF